MKILGNFMLRGRSFQTKANELFFVDFEGAWQDIPEQGHLTYREDGMDKNVAYAELLLCQVISFPNNATGKTHEGWLFRTVDDDMLVMNSSLRLTESAYYETYPEVIKRQSLWKSFCQWLAESW